MVRPIHAHQEESRAPYLGERFAIPRISTGDMLQAGVKEGAEIGTTLPALSPDPAG